MAVDANARKTDPPKCEKCGEKSGVQFDRDLGKMLCNWCWANTPIPGKRPT